MKRWMVLLLAFLLLLGFAGCSLSEKAPEVAEEEAAEEAAEEATEEATVGTVRATITVKDYGVIELELYPNVAPQSVYNFVYLARQGFYDGLTFHRVVSGFMIQGGDPNGNGTGGPGYSVKGEFAENGFENNLSHTRGVISMARATDPDSAGSQFFIMHEDTYASQLDGKYAAFGMVTSGMEVVDAIAAVPVGGLYGSDPLTPVVIESITVEAPEDLPEPEKLPE